MVLVFNALAFII